MTGSVSVCQESEKKNINRFHTALVRTTPTQMHIADTFGPGQHSGVIAVYSHESKSEYKHNQPGRLERVLTLGGYMDRN